MKKTIDGVEYKVIKCKKYKDVLDCPIDYFECIYCEHQTWYMKWISRKLRKNKKR